MKEVKFYTKEETKDRVFSFCCLKIIIFRSLFRLAPMGARYLCVLPSSSKDSIKPFVQSPSEQGADEPVVRTFQKMPATLTRLINDPRFNDKWPSPAAITGE